MNFPARSVHTSLLAAMLGASIALAISRGTANPSAWVFIAIVVLVLHAVNFYHGKMMAFADERMVEIEARPVFRSVLLICNTVLFLIFCVMAAKITNPFYIAGGEAALRVVDIGLVASEQRLGDPIAGQEGMLPSLGTQLRYWQRMNSIALISNVALLLIMPTLSNDLRYPLVVSVLTVLVSIDLIVEYWNFRANYFEHRGDSWNSMAERWDRLQGEFGDVYRQEVIYPKLREWVTEHGVTACVDLGCGNGCTSRMLSQKLNVTPLGVDSSPEMVDLAELYETRNVSVRTSDTRPRYLVAAVDNPAPGDDYGRIASLVGELREQHPGRLGLVALFTAQDCGNLSGFFEVAARLLHPCESLFIVYEARGSFDPTEEHSVTQRAWKYSFRRAVERTQVVIWLPVAVTAPSSLFASDPPDRHPPINVETHFRILDDYRSAAECFGMQEVAWGELNLTESPKDMAELRYLRKPKFCYAEFSQPTVKVTSAERD